MSLRDDGVRPPTAVSSTVVQLSVVDRQLTVSWRRVHCDPRRHARSCVPTVVQSGLLGTTRGTVVPAEFAVRVRGTVEN